MEVLGSSRGGVGWSPNFLRSLNGWEMERFLSTLHWKRINAFQEDLLILKSPKAENFSVKLMYRMLEQSSATTFPLRSIWNPIVPPQDGLFPLGNFLGKGDDFRSAKTKGKSSC